MKLTLVTRIEGRTSIKYAKVGFSVATVFFGFLVPLFRRMKLRYATDMLFFGLITFGLSNIIFAFFINDEYIRTLVERGYKPVYLK